MLQGGGGRGGGGKIRKVERMKCEISGGWTEKRGQESEGNTIFSPLCTP